MINGEMPEGLLERTGACRFCGQMKILHLTEEWSQERLNEEATCSCGCADARAYAYRKESFEKAQQAVETLFSEGSRIKWLYKITLDPKLKELMFRIMEAMASGIMEAVTINEGRVDIKMSISPAGNFKVKWNYKDKGVAGE